MTERDIDTWRGTVSSGGRLRVPAAIRRILNLRDGDDLLLEVIDGELSVRRLLTPGEERSPDLRIS